MEKLMEKSLHALKLICYPMMRQIAIGMTGSYLPPVVARRATMDTQPSQNPIQLNLKTNKRLALKRMTIRHSH